MIRFQSLSTRRKRLIRFIPLLPDIARNSPGVDKFWTNFGTDFAASRSMQPVNPGGLRRVEDGRLVAFRSRVQ